MSADISGYEKRREIERTSDLAMQKINSYYEAFLVDSSVLDTSHNQTCLVSKFDTIEGKKIIFAQDI